MDLRPTPSSRRTAIITAVGAGLFMLVAATFVASGAWFFALIMLAALATFLPAVGALTARVSADPDGVSVRRFGHARHYGWNEIRSIAVVERRASVPDGTEYHWMLMSGRPHVVAVPYLELAKGASVELPALASPAGGTEPRPADENAAALTRAQSPERSR